jgi:hypothetical protein
MYYNTVNQTLLSALMKVMSAEVFDPFRLVGGTALSLQLGHRISVDIDLFSDAQYGSIDFTEIDRFIEENFIFRSHLSEENVAFGKSYIVGEDSNNTIKIDVFYSDAFIQAPLVIDSIRLATLEEIAAMKLDVIQRGGRKKDFWDIHELIPLVGIAKMLDLHQERYPFTHNRIKILENIVSFESSDDDFDPICLRGNYWELIKEDIEMALEQFKKVDS